MRKKLLKSFFKQLKHGGFKVIYWDGEEIEYGDDEPQVTIEFKENLPLEFDLSEPILSFGEGYMDGIIDFKGKLEELMRIIKLNRDNINSNDLSSKMMLKFNEFKNKALQKQQKEDIKQHYDLGNEFFSLWLDETLSYSCAYFKTPEDTLYQAQLQKIDHTLKKLNLQPDDRLLDIGSGWGWLIVKAAKQYDVEAVGITLSEEQYQATQKRIKNLGLEEQVKVKLLDYLDLPEDEEFDKIVSIGMFEHVGKENLFKYMEKVKQLLAEGGISLLHTITGLTEEPVNKWVDKYIFPNGYIPALQEIISLLSEYNLHFLHAENLRQHYAMTLDCWHDNFCYHLDKIEDMFDQRFIRMWDLYLRGAAANFRIGNLNIHQLLFSKDEANCLPLTFDYMYN
ncbi:class I SAM-dependent methyltransferase [Sporohalobacter salinus]|uniref:class I SAM-dependent methyltransferase n=1 Tax=Sporohalobacter salinus TaxID=1494606 RepID=UPI0019609BEF|nr:class I SAM-dependent methyltransferase [Sporohalobacter salinus]MBM7624517.1 cyclopropane-fatty-acyl-phospholipid synthase [Sporohalobacter salinus]